MARLFLWLALLCASLMSFATNCAGIHLELTHVDAKDKCTVEERLRRATERTHRRLASMGGVTAPVHWAGSTQYIAEYLIGDPPQRAEAIIDTGSNLVWTQCSLCRRTSSCFPQSLPYYDPSQSSSDRAVACDDSACHLGSETQCDGKACAVDTGYGAGTISGLLGTETFAFGSENVSLAFGCINATKLTPGSLNNASGIIGLGRGNLSLVSQLGDTKFSYCLTPYFSDAMNRSHLFVGASAGLSDDAPVTSVPFVQSPNDDPYGTFYYLPLTGITVGGTMLDVPAAAFDLREVAPGRWAGTFIDSGAPFTRLVDVAYRALRDELAQQLGASLVTPPAQGYDLCVASGNMGSLVPQLVLHFGSGGGGGSELVVPPENYWLNLDTTTACMVVFSSAGPNATLPMNETTVIGNYMQQNMHLLYDLGNGVLSFQPADCATM